MLIRTARFGDLEVDEQSFWIMKNPILGFEESKRFVVIPQKDSPFEYFQAVDDEHLTFILADPFPFFQCYDFLLEKRWIDMLQLKSDREINIRTIVTVRTPQDISLNLKAPIIMNTALREAAQIILDTPGYSTRHSIIERAQKEEDYADPIEE